MLVLAEQACEQNEEVSVRFGLPIEGRIAVCKARVQWARVRPGPHAAQAIGLEFIDASNEIRASLARYVALMTGELKEPVEPMPMTRRSPVEAPYESGEMPAAKLTVPGTPAALVAARAAAANH